jgi:hypothetical protein
LGKHDDLVLAVAIALWRAHGDNVERGRLRILPADVTNQFGADVSAAPPNNPVRAILGKAGARKEQLEFIGNIEPIGIDPHAAVGNVGHEAVTWRGAIPGLDDLR